MDNVRKERFLVKRIGKRRFSVLSLDSTSGQLKQYCVRFNDYRWICNCPHFLKHSEDPNFVCKHILAVIGAQAKPVVLKRKVRALEKQIVFG